MGLVLTSIVAFFIFVAFIVPLIVAYVNWDFKNLYDLDYVIKCIRIGILVALPISMVAGKEFGDE
jgi:amino acid permease